MDRTQEQVSMEESELLKERIQAITDKRRVQEDIAKKRRLIEEEKLQLQYIKKKALREQWLMDGLSPQTGEDLEAQRLQAQGEQEQTVQLQSNIDRIEKEIEDLETHELNISANEEVILKRLKEVERTAEDIIKDANTGERELDGHQATGGCSSPENTDLNGTSYFTDTVAMETAEHSDTAAPADREVELATGAVDGGEMRVSPGDEQEQIRAETDPTDAAGEDLLDLFPDPPPDAMELEDPEDEESGLCGDTTSLDHKDSPCPGTGHDELNRNESIASSVSDTLSSADSVYENEAHRKRPDPQEPEPEPSPGEDLPPGPQDQEDLLPGTQDLEDLLPGLEDQEDLPPAPLDLEDLPPAPLDQEDLPPGPQDQEDQDQEDLPPGPLDQEDHDQEDLLPGPPDKEDQDQEDLPPGPLDMEDKDREDLLPEPLDQEDLLPEPLDQEDLLPEPLDQEDQDQLAPETREDPVSPDFPLDAPTGEAEDSNLGHYINEDALSDASNEPYHELEADECLRVEIAVASSDSDTDEKWRAIFSSSINREDDDSYLDGLQLSAQELFVQKVEVSDAEEEEDHAPTEETPFEEEPDDEVLEQPIDVVSFSSPSQEVLYNPLSQPGLCKISEDDGENGKDPFNRGHLLPSPPLSADHTKKLPKDFCVIQETKSENVSNEHVDFQVARKQWLEMEEQSKKQIVSPTAKTPTLQGSHSFMYTPVRNVERPQRREHSLENLSLVGDYPLTQFSPCSEDSGLDDLSYRSPFEDPETPVEREVRAALERDDHLRKGRGFSKMGKSTDCAPSRGLPRSISTPLTPSFVITSSPSKGSRSHELAANNVIILEPGDDFPGGQNHTAWDQVGDSNLIILETSNLIIRSASEFCLSQVREPQSQEKSFLNNPFFKLRSRSSVSLVDEEIRVVKQREEELRKERASAYGKDRFGSSVTSPNQMDSLAFSNTVDVPEKCKSSPSSPMKTAYRMDRAVLSCDHRFPDVYSKERRKSAMALRWEAGEFAEEKAD
ncbi:paralemmin-3 isoform X3 [Gadus macrocephalus]|uniref:paralemmin-3 isoform X3 n=1 Tax=Gadus macrocephalus TaxID=80720 RepID=UPI0028CB2F69|nr:paralemmin-3 isoform X3 [Gadus macrocephalus]